MVLPNGAVAKGVGLVVVVGVAVAYGLYILTEGKIAEDPSLPTPATLAAVEQIQREDPERGARVKAGMEQYRTSCRLCHHRSGHGGNFTPNLQRHNAASVLTLLDQYRAGVTVGPMTDLMAPWARELTPEEMVNLAEYIQVLAELKE